jgi:hypothetical protein
VNDAIREAFEKINEPTESVYFNEELSEYCFGYTKTAAPINDKWESFCEGWLASSQRIGKPIYDPRSVSFNLLNRLEAVHEAARQIPDLEAQLRHVLGSMGYDLVVRSPFTAGKGGE